MFHALQAEEKLDEVDIFCLHYVYLSRLNSALKTFQESWNNHTISTARNLTPNQLFIQGAIAHDCFPRYPELDSDVPSPVLRGEEAVLVPRCNFCPCSGLCCYLFENVDPLQQSADFGRSVYFSVCNIVGEHLNTCTSCCMI